MERSRGAFDVVLMVGIGGFIIWLYSRLNGKTGAAPTAKSPGGGPDVGGIVNRATAAVASTLVHVLLIVLLLALLALVGMVLSRLYWRYQRAQRTVLREIVLGPDDVATPFEVMSALDAIHMTLLTRYAGAAYGQDYWTFEIIRDEEGIVHFVIGSHELRIRRIEQAFQAKYQNIRFQPYIPSYEPTFGFAQQLTLHKPWWFATETVRDYTNSVVETVVQALEAADGPVHLQYHMTPLPMGVYHQKLQAYIRGREYALRSEQADDPSHQGVGYVEDKQQKNSLQLMGKGVFRTEIRLGTMTWGDGQGIIGALGEANDENSLQARLVVAGRTMWHRWLRARMPALYLFRANVMFSFPMATIIHLPSNRLRVNSLVRKLVRRQPASRVIPKFSDVGQGIMLDQETGAAVGIPERDREANILVVGSQGSGKTTDLLNIFRSDVGFKDNKGRWKAVVLIDIGKDTSKRALGLVPPGRPVAYFAPGDPACGWTVNPLQASLSDSVVADNVLAAMTQVFGEEAIRFRSREFLGNAVMALRQVMGKRADFTSMYKLLTDEGFRNWVSGSVTDPHQVEFWQHTVPASMEANPRYLTDELAAPRNKLDELLRNPLIRGVFDSSSSRRLLDMREILERRMVLVVNLDKAKLGDEGARLLGIILIQLLWNALQSQNDIEERDRVPCSLILDESQNYVADGFLDLLAEGRAYGLQTTLALRFLGELPSERVIDGLHALVQNVIIHQFQLLSEAEVFMKRFMRVYANMVQVAAEVQDQVNFGADDIMRLPKFTTICQWMVGGDVQQPFLGETINWEPFFNDEWRSAHLTEQPGQGAGDVGSQAVAEPPSAVSAPAPPVAVPAKAVGSAAPVPDPTDRPLRRKDDAASEIDLASVDALTGLANRRGLEMALAGSPETSAVAFVDADGLKELNDGDGGHAAGDAMLKRCADAIRSAAREGDIAGRYGGDEYVIIMPGFTQDQVKPWVSRVRASLEAHAVQASIGIALQEPGESLARTMERADQAMYEDKRRRKAGRSEAGLTADGEALVYRLASERKVSATALLSAIAASGATEEDVTRTCLWMLDRRTMPAPRVLPVFKESLKGAVAERVMKTAKSFTCEKLGIGRPQLEALLHRTGVSDETFLERARAFWKGKAGKPATVDEFAQAMMGASTEVSVDVRALAERLGASEGSLRRAAVEESIPLDELEAFCEAFLSANGGHGTVNELRVAWRQRGAIKAASR